MIVRSFCNFDEDDCKFDNQCCNIVLDITELLLTPTLGLYNLSSRVRKLVLPEGY